VRRHSALDVLPPVLLGSGVAWQQRRSSVDSASRAFDTRTIGSGVAWQARSSVNGASRI
jgi:surface antigen